MATRAHRHRIPREETALTPSGFFPPVSENANGTQPWQPLPPQYETAVLHYQRLKKNR